MQRKLIVFTLTAALVACNAIIAGAQERERKLVIVPPAEQEVFIRQGPGAPGDAPPVEAQGDNLIFLATEMSFAGRLVKGAPYSAQAVSESVQMLTDGNRIVRKNSAQVYRDSEGRTRRDQSLGYIGPYATSGDVPQTVFVNDPVAGSLYILDPATKTARKLPRMKLSFKTEGAAPGQQTPPPGTQQKIEIERSYTVERMPDAPPAAGGPAGVPPSVELSGPTTEFHLANRSKADSKTEKLDARSFDGVMAEGTRTTTTIAVGEIGNEQPIQIVDERWYSPELQVVVMTRHSDPRSGETTYRLTNITRTEPAATLFQVPSDYTVKDVSTMGGPGVRHMRRPASAPPQEN
ncbi:MAG: hypothetical protein QOJ70_1648 [Acidobacteriota bacterium]|jgi:hypothetical protein|nr:hypothetical protein [Acidobacteriota bacterium]